MASVPEKMMYLVLWKIQEESSTFVQGSQGRLYTMSAEEETNLKGKEGTYEDATVKGQLQTGPSRPRAGASSAQRGCEVWKREWAPHTQCNVGARACSAGAPPLHLRGNRHLPLPEGLHLRKLDNGSRSRRMTVAPSKGDRLPWTGPVWGVSQRCTWDSDSDQIRSCRTRRVTSPSDL